MPSQEPPGEHTSWVLPSDTVRSRRSIGRGPPLDKSGMPPTVPPLDSEVTGWRGRAAGAVTQ